MKNKETAEARASKLIDLAFKGLALRGTIYKQQYEELKQEAKFYEKLATDIPKPDAYAFIENLAIKAQQHVQAISGRKVDMYDVAVKKVFVEKVRNEIVESEQDKYYYNSYPNLRYHPSKEHTISEDIKKTESYLTSYIKHGFKQEQVIEEIKPIEKMKEISTITDSIFKKHEEDATSLVEGVIYGLTLRGLLKGYVLDQKKESKEYHEYIAKILPKPDVYTYFESLIEEAEIKAKTPKFTQETEDALVEIVACKLYEAGQTKENVWYPELKPINTMRGLDYYQAMVLIVSEDIENIQPYYNVYAEIKTNVLEVQKLKSVESSTQTELKEVEEKEIQTREVELREEEAQSEIKELVNQRTQVNFLDKVKADTFLSKSAQLLDVIMNFATRFTNPEHLKELVKNAKIKYEFYTKYIKEANSFEEIENNVRLLDEEYKTIELIGQELLHDE